MTALPTTAPADTALVAGRRATWSAWAGIAFAPVFAAGFFMAVAAPDDKAGDASWLAWYADSGHRTALIAGGFLMIGAALLFLAFAAGLLERLRAARDSSPVAHRLAGWAAVMVGGLLMVGAIQFVGVVGNFTFGGMPLPHNADVLRQNIGFPFLTVAAGISAALFVATIATMAHRSGLFRTWLVAVSYVVAVAVLFGIEFVPMIALPIWALIAGVAALQGVPSDRRAAHRDKGRDR